MDSVELTSLMSAATGVALFTIAWRLKDRDPATRRILMALGIFTAIMGFIGYLLAARRAHAECHTGVDSCVGVNTPAISPGDLVTFQAELCSNEVPPLLDDIWLYITTSAAQPNIFQMQIYDSPRVFQYVATGYGELPTGIISNAGFGGQSGCALTVFPTSRPQRINASTKAALQNVITLINLTNSSLSTLALMCSTKYCALIFGAIQVATGAGAVALGLTLNHDPPDSAYTVVAKPILSARPSGIPLWAEALIDNELHIQALCEALYTAVNRVNTAVDMGDAAAEDLQQGAIDRYLHRLGKRFADEIELRRQLVRRFARRHFDASALADPALLEALAAASAAL